MLPSVTIVRGQGALGRPLPGEDYISGLAFFTDTLPSGFDSTHRIKQVLSVAQAEALGILGDYSDEVQSTSTIQITAVGANGDTLSVDFGEPDGTSVHLGTYTKVSSDTTVNNVATGVRNAINLNTPSTGYSASVSTDTVTVTVRKGLGIYPDTGTPLTTTIVGTITDTVVNSVTNGTASLLAQWHYHIKEYFRLNPKGNLFTGFFPITAQTWNFAEIVTMQTFAQGKIRQIGLYLDHANSDFSSAANIVTVLNACQLQKAALDTVHAPLSIKVTTDISTISDLTTLQDLSALSDFGVSYSIGQDGSNLGFAIFKAQGYSIGDIGAQLGALSVVAVNQDQGCLAYVNYTDGSELSKPCYANGTAVDLIAAVNLATQLNNYRYIFLQQNIGFSGTGTTINDNHCAVSFSSDYAYENDNRVFDKMHRLLYAQFIPILKSTIKLKEDGTLTNEIIAYYNAQIAQALNVMLTSDPLTGNQELAAELPTIDPNQNVLATGNLVISVQATPEGVARNIIIGLSF